MKEPIKVNIGEMRSEHVEEIIQFKGKVIQISEVRPQVVNAKFRCPSCKSEVKVPQIGKIFQKPVNCSCGNNSNFKEISKEIVDTQRIILEDLKSNLLEGELPSKIDVFLKEDLTDYNKREFILPGKEVTIVGTLKMVPVYVDDGDLSVRFDLAVETKEIIS